MPSMTPEEIFVHDIVDKAVKPLQDEITMLKRHNIEMLEAVANVFGKISNDLANIEHEVYKCL